MEAKLTAAEKAATRRQNDRARLDRDRPASALELAERRKSLEDLRARTAAITPTAASAALAKSLEEKSRQVADLESRRAELRAALQAERQAIKEVEAAVSGAIGKQAAVTYRIPFERRTTRKQGPVFECDGARIYLLTPENYTAKEHILTKDKVDALKTWIGKVQGRPPTEEDWQALEALLPAQPLSLSMDGVAIQFRRTAEQAIGLDGFSYMGLPVKRLGFLVSFQRMSTAKGELAKSLAEKDNALRSRLAAGKPAGQYAIFIVRPTGFAALRDARAVIEGLGYEATWSYEAAELRKLRYPIGGGDATVK